MEIGDHQILLRGEVVVITREQARFTRQLSLAGSYGSVKEQRRKRYVGSPVLVAAAGGPDLHTIIAVSTDGHTWRGDDGKERLTSAILL